jgi:predicted ATPase
MCLVTPLVRSRFARQALGTHCPADGSGYSGASDRYRRQPRGRGVEQVTESRSIQRPATLSPRHTPRPEWPGNVSSRARAMSYLQRIEVHNHYRLKDFAIDFQPPPEGCPFRHLILTGPNGSGKTTVLTQLAQAVTLDLSGGQGAFRKRDAEANLRGMEAVLASFPAGSPDRRSFEPAVAQHRAALSLFSVEPSWVPNLPEPGSLFAAFLPAQRLLQVDKPRAIEKVDLLGAAPNQPVARNILKHLVNLEVQSRLAKEDDPGTAGALRQWLESMEQALADLFEIPGLSMRFVRRDYDIRFVEPSGAEYDFNQLAAGHASVLNILAEILLRVPESALTTVDGALATMPGVVIIDELETHLHPALQERVLPFLVKAFPTTQFIVATHSPIVICSIDNAVVWDLRSMQGVLSDELRGTPYGDLMKIHFGIETDIDLESTEQLKRLRELRDNPGRSPTEQAEFERLASRLRKTSGALALEIWTQLEQAKLAASGE